MLIGLVFLCGSARAQQPKAVTIGTNPAGTVFYPVAGGLASVISGSAPFQAGIQPWSAKTDEAQKKLLALNP
jgi:TRAP-type uncharacterized transport system substrate-binding protein